MEEMVIMLGILGSLFLVLFVGGFIADYVFPLIPVIKRFLDTLPEIED